MLRLVITDRYGHETPLHSALTVTLDCDISVPAASLTVTCPYDGALRRNADKIKAFDGETLLFTGQLDSIVTEKQTAGVLLRLSARSPAAALLDNEAEPVTYVKPTDGLMESRHLAPFGIVLAEKDNIPCYGVLQINKGMSHWQVLQSFCRNRYGCEPRVTGDGRAVLNGKLEPGEAFFSDRGGGVRYYSLRESQKRHSLLSEVRLKFAQQNAYCSVIKNNNPAAASVKRVRYVNAAADKTTLATAEQMLRSSNRESYALRLSCLGCHVPVLGKRAAVDDSLLGRLDGLVAEQVRYTADSSGERTVVTLKKEAG